MLYAFAAIAKAARVSGARGHVRGEDVVRVTVEVLTGPTVTHGRPGSSVPVHPGTAAVEQDRAPHPAFDGAVHGPADRRRQRDQDDLAALAAHAKDTVTMLFTQVVDAGAGGLEDPQAQQPKHGYQREVIPVRGLARGGQHSLELEM